MPVTRSGILGNGAIYAAIFGLGAALWWISANHPARMPFWAPWDFSASEYLTAALTLFWFLRGLARSSPGERPRVWRRVLFVLGVALIYFVLQTRYDYWAQHLFTLNRVQHIVMHHVGPFFIALGWAGTAMTRGMPSWVLRIARSRPVAKVMRVIQEPWLAGFLFVGLFFFWLIPGIHFRAMTDARLYEIMNWSMVLDGVLFWCLVLDMRPKPPAQVSFQARVALAIGVMIPEIILAGFLSFWPHDLYPYYDLCGRLVPSISALQDQHYGGIAILVPAGMMSMIGALLAVVALGHDGVRRRAAQAAREGRSAW